LLRFGLRPGKEYTMLNCRIYPNGEFSIWAEKKDLKVEGPPDQPDYLGLSLLPISHKVALGLSDPPKERAREGVSGITRHGARTVRNGAFLLEEKYGRENLTFLTCTLPWIEESAEYAAGKEWGEIIRIFKQNLTRLLVAAGLPPTYVGCTEIQEKRYRDRGGLPLHIHLVFPGRKPFGHWTISADQFRSQWRSAVISRCPEFGSASFKASVDCQRVRQSAESYLGKYMTKGAAGLSLMLKGDPGLADFLPKSWWCCSLNLRRAVGRRIAGGNGSAIRLIRDVRGNDTRISFSSEVKVELADGTILPVAVVGKLSAEGRKRYCHSWHLSREKATASRC
jgi:hypothetical protein